MIETNCYIFVDDGGGPYNQAVMPEGFNKLNSIRDCGLELKPTDEIYLITLRASINIVVELVD